MRLRKWRSLGLFLRLARRSADTRGGRAPRKVTVRAGRTRLLPHARAPRSGGRGRLHPAFLESSWPRVDQNCTRQSSREIRPGSVFPKNVASSIALSSARADTSPDDVGREHVDRGSPLRLRSGYAFLLADTARWRRRVSAPRCRPARLLHVPRPRGALPRETQKNARHFADERASYRDHPAACGVREPSTGAEGAATDA